MAASLFDADYSFQGTYEFDVLGLGSATLEDSQAQDASYVKAGSDASTTTSTTRPTSSDDHDNPSSSPSYDDHGPASDDDNRAAADHDHVPTADYDDEHNPCDDTDYDCSFLDDYDHRATAHHHDDVANVSPVRQEPCVGRHCRRPETRVCRGDAERDRRGHRRIHR